MRIDQNELVYRDQIHAKLESARGFHHAGYWMMNICKLLSFIGVKCSHVRVDSGDTGAHFYTFTDPTTGDGYEIRVTPCRKIP